MATTSRAPTTEDPPTSNLGRAFVVLLFVAALVGVPLLLLYGSSWFGIERAVPGDDRPLPQWFTPAELRSTTRDGAIMKVRVSMDAGSWSNRQALQHRLVPITELLQATAGMRKADDLAGSAGIEKLRKDLFTGVNKYLEAEGVKPILSMAVQDLWYTRP